MLIFAKNPSLQSGFAATLLFVFFLTTPAPGQGVSNALNRLLQNESLPPERLPAILEMASQRGDAKTLEIVFDKATTSDVWKDDIKSAALEALAEAANKRKLKPEGDLSRLKSLLDAGQSEAVRTQAIRLAGLWRIPELAEPLEAIVRDGKTPAKTRAAALEALAQFGEVGRKAIESLARNEKSFTLRAAAISALASLDLKASANAAASLLATAKPRDDLALILGTFLERRDGSKTLALELAEVKLDPDLARAALEHLYAVGRNDAELSAALAAAAGIAMQDKPLSPAEIEKLSAAVMTEGDAARGELVFRRDDLSCLKCHSISGAGGDIGPDLSGIGPSNPIDHLVTSIVDPDAAVKEQFATQNIVTEEGIVVTGIVANETADVLTLRTAEGLDRVIPKADILDHQSGGSLMPKGLVKFMTRAELLDLVRFLSQLGKPGTPYALRSQPTIQRWRILIDPPAALRGTIPSDAEFTKALPPLSAPNWEALYSRVDGSLHTSDLGTKQPVYLLAEIDVEQGGPVGIQFNDPTGLDLWINGEHIDDLDRQTVTALGEGRHTIVVRIHPIAREEIPLTTTTFQPKNSSARAKPVDGT